MEGGKKADGKNRTRENSGKKCLRTGGSGELCVRPRESRIRARKGGGVCILCPITEVFETQGKVTVKMVFGKKGGHRRKVKKPQK